MKIKIFRDGERCEIQIVGSEEDIPNMSEFQNDYNLATGKYILIKRDDCESRSCRYFLETIAIKV